MLSPGGKRGKGNCSFCAATQRQLNFIDYVKHWSDKPVQNAGEEHKWPDKKRAESPGTTTDVARPGVAVFPESQDSGKERSKWKEAAGRPPQTPQTPPFGQSPSAVTSTATTPTAWTSNTTKAVQMASDFVK